MPRHTATGLVVAMVVGGQVSAESMPDSRLNRYESAVIPALAGDTDVGVKFGGVGQLVRFEDSLEPYAWKAQTLILLSVRDGPVGFEYPYREVFFWFDEPHLSTTQIRLIFSTSYYRTTNLGYYGLGNDLSVARPWEAFDVGSEGYAVARHFYQYDGTSIFAQGAGLFSLGQDWIAYAGTKLEHTSIIPYDGTLLAQHRVAVPGSGTQLVGLGEATRFIESWGLIYDTRDHETVTTNGQWHELGFRASPGLFDLQTYMGTTLVLRTYRSLYGEKFSVGARALVDALTKNAPLNELGRFGGLESRPGPAGAQGIRGIPQGRLHGRTKLIGNLEARSLFLPFALLGEQANLGAAVFFDAGRVWTKTFRSVRALDGTGLGLHWGIGAGPRIRYGESLLIRLDVAYAPLGAELGAAPAMYVDVVHVL